MKTNLNYSLKNLRICSLWKQTVFLLSAPHILIALLAFGISSQRANAEVNVNIEISHGYSFYFPRLSLNDAPAPVTFHMIENASGTLWRQFGSTNGGNDFFLTNHLDAVIHECTNGLWKLYLNRGHASEEIYYFAMSITGVTTNVLGDVNILHPLDGSTGVSATPTYQWTGPSNLPTIFANSSHESGSGNYHQTNLPGTATEWTPGLLTPGANTLYVNYSSNNFLGITFTTPTNTSGTPLAGWSAQGSLSSYKFSDFTVAGSSEGGHKLHAHYSFENGDIFAADYSGNENHISTISSTSGGKRFTTNNPALGNHAAFFDNNSGTGGGWLNGPEELLPTLSGSFTISLWVQTTQTSGSDNDDGLFGNAGLVAAFSGPSGNWVVPMALTGNKLAFTTGGDPQHTLHSSVAITNGSEFVHLVVTRNRATGEKKIYVNGTLDASGTGSTDLLDSPTDLDIGYNNGTGLQGAMDEIQFYSGVLSEAEVTFLYENPGSTVPDIGGDPELGEAVDAPQLIWSTGADAEWFAQTDETNDGLDAAQSGAIDHNQESWIETTVTGPGVFSFSWNVSSDDSESNDYLEFSIDGSSETTISGDWGWDTYEIFLDEGEHTLRWIYYKDGASTGGQDSAWLDEVKFEQEIEISMSLTIERNNSPGNSGFFAYPSFDNHWPDPLTSYEIVSPSGWASCYLDANESYSSYSSLATLDEVISELENGDWTLYINRGHPQERQFTFTVTVDDLDISKLPPADITSPAESATDITTNHTFAWTGPSDFDSLFLSSYQLTNFSASGGFISPLPTATNGTMPNPLVPGGNGLYIVYRDFGFDGVSISEPLDSSFNSLTSWSADVVLTSSQTRRFTVSSEEPPPATPVQILNPQFAGSNINFSLITQAGRTHTVQSRTNLTTAPWVNITNFVGDGNLIQLVVPIFSQAESYFRIGTE